MEQHAVKLAADVLGTVADGDVADDEIPVPFCSVKEDFQARDMGVTVYCLVCDTGPNL